MQLGQANPDEHDWRVYTGTFDNNEPFAKLLVIGNNSIGEFAANTEYWYVNKSSLQYLGSHDLSFSHTDGTGTPPSYSATQQFTLPGVVPWQSFTSDPVNDGYLFDNGKLHLRFTGDSTNGLTRVTWYQILGGGSPANVTPDGTFSGGSASVTVASGYSGYYISQTP